jgi:basic amino acid/polyamine antiporter, APA family
LKQGEESTSQNSLEPELRRELSLLDSTMINVGSMIGSGIFLVPATVALYLQSAPAIVVLWIVGGIISLFGALSIAELGTLYPAAGGQYVYLEKAYGPLWGFLYGWSAFSVILTAAISAVAVGFATYLGYFIPLSPLGIKIVAIVSIIVLTVINCLGVRSGAVVQNILTFLKIGMLAALVALCFIMKGGTVFDAVSSSTQISPTEMIGTLGMALVAILWSYDGWIEITYVGGEVKNPKRVMPLSLILSTLVVILLYVLVNIAFISLLSVNSMSTSTMVAADASTALIGPLGAKIAVVAVIIATLGSNNGFILTGARIYYAMASERVFFRSFANVHPSFHTPIPSLVGQGTWACLLVLSGTFNQLITYTMFASWIFYGMTAAAVIVLRKKSPDIPRSYKTWGYPVTPVIFVLFSLYLVVATMIESPRDALFGLAIILLGLPAYFYWNRKKRLSHA